MAGSTSVTLDADFFNEESFAFNQQLVDGLNVKCPFLAGQQEVHGKGGKPEWPAGKSRWISDLLIGTHTNLTATPTGAEPIDLTQIASKAQFVFSPAFSQQPVVMTGYDRRLGNGAKNESRRTWSQRVTAVNGNTSRLFERQIISGGVTGYSNANWNSLNGVDRTTGFLEAAASGSQTRSVGGLSKATLATVPGMNNQFFDGNSAAASNVLRAFHNADTQVQLYADPKNLIWYLSATCYDFYKQASLPLERFVDKAADAGRRIEVIGGRKCVVENYMPVDTASGGSASNTTPVSAYGIDHEMIYVAWGAAFSDNLGPVASGFFGITDAVPVDGAHDMVAAKVQIFGQLVTAALVSSVLIAKLQVY